MTSPLDDARGELLTEWDDPHVQIVYELICADETPPNPEEHWEGYLARRIVAALRAAPVPQCDAGHKSIADMSPAQTAILGEALGFLTPAQAAHQAASATLPSRSDAGSAELLRDQQIKAAWKAIIACPAFADFSSSPNACALDMATAAIDAAALVSPPSEAGREIEALLNVLDVSIPDDGLLKGKLMMAIGHKGSQICWTPQNSYEHAVINLLGCKLRDLRTALSRPDQGTVAVSSADRGTP